MLHAHPRAIHVLLSLLITAPLLLAGCTQDRAGDSLYIRLAPEGTPSENALNLSVNDTRTRAPALAKALDRALSEGPTSIPEGERQAQALRYLDEEAKATGAPGFREEPIRNRVLWRGEVVHAIVVTID